MEEIQKKKLKEHISSIVNESLRRILYEHVGSRKLARFIDEHGGIDKKSLNGTTDINAITDDDIIGSARPETLSEIYKTYGRQVVDHGRWSDSHALDKYAEDLGLKRNPGDEVVAIRFNDGYYLLVNNRNGRTFNDYAGNDATRPYLDKRADREAQRIPERRKNGFLAMQIARDGGWKNTTDARRIEYQK